MSTFHILYKVNKKVYLMSRMARTQEIAERDLRAMYKRATVEILKVVIEGAEAA